MNNRCNMQRPGQHREPYVGMPVCLDGCMNINCGNWGDHMNSGSGSNQGGNNSGNNNGNQGGNNNNGSNGGNWGNNNNQGGNNGGNWGGTIGQMCSCLENLPLAMAYVPMQRWNEVYDMTEGFYAGTIFPELNLPFVGGGGR